MFKKFVSSWMLLVVMAAGIGTLARQADAAPAVQTAVARQALPAAPAAPAQIQAPARVQLSTAQMADAHGDGWLSKLWKKYKKKIIKFIWEIVKEIIEGYFTNTTSTADSAITGTVTENYEGTDVTEEVYQDQAAYDAGQMSSSSSTDGAYDYVSTDYSGGCYCGGGDGPLNRDMAY